MRARDALALVRAALASTLMFMVAAVVPVLGGLTMILAPFPILYAAVGYRNAVWRALGIALAAAGLIGAAGGLEAAITYLVTVGIAAAGICYMLETRQSLDRIVGTVALLMVAVGAASAFWLAGSVQAVTELLRNNLTLTMAHGAQFYSRVGLDSALTADRRASIVEWTLQLMPALALLSAATVVLANLALFWRFGGRQSRVGYALFGELARWSAPEWLIWVLLVSGFALFAPIAEIRTAALNCFVCLAAIYFCQGLAIMSFYFHVLAMPRLARGLVYLITGIQPVLAVLVSVAGIFDMWIDFRRLRPSNPQSRNLGNLL